MGADSFLAFYGIKIALDPDDEQTLETFETCSAPQCKAAERAGLQTHLGRLTDGEDYFLYVGCRIGWLGLEYDDYVQVTIDELAEMVGQVKSRLKEAGFDQIPALHLQLEAQY